MTASTDSSAASKTVSEARDYGVWVIVGVAALGMVVILGMAVWGFGVISDREQARSRCHDKGGVFVRETPGHYLCVSGVTVVP